jgi:hypothetical protein
VQASVPFFVFYLRKVVMNKFETIFGFLLEDILEDGWEGVASSVKQLQPKVRREAVAFLEKKLAEKQGALRLKSDWIEQLSNSQTRVNAWRVERLDYLERDVKVIGKELRLCKFLLEKLENS